MFIMLHKDTLGVHVEWNWETEAAEWTRKKPGKNLIMISTLPLNADQLEVLWGNKGHQAGLSSFTSCKEISKEICSLFTFSESRSNLLFAVIATGILDITIRKIKE